jgi:hypothetical protein
MLGFALLTPTYALYHSLDKPESGSPLPSPQATSLKREALIGRAFCPRSVYEMI